MHKRVCCVLKEGSIIIVRFISSISKMVLADAELQVRLTVPGRRNNFFRTFIFLFAKLCYISLPYMTSVAAVADRVSVIVR